MENKEQKRKKLPKLKRNIKEFLNSEEGKISKKSIMKAGLLLGALGMITDSGTASAACGVNHVNHANGGLHNSGNTGSHNSSHCSHASHSSHSNDCGRYS